MIQYVDDQMIYYDVKGEGLPIIILHGLYLDSLTMIHAIEESSISLNGFKRIYIDMPGMGQSPAHNLENNSDTILELLTKLIEKLVANRPFIIMGYSYGGYIARGIAKKFMNQVIGEVLICPVVVPQLSKRRVASIVHQDIDREFLDSLPPLKQEELLNRMVVINKRTYHRSETDFLRATALANSGFLQALFSGKYASDYIEQDHRIHNHKALFLLGYQDTSVGYQDALDILAYYPHANVNILTDASHSFFLEHPSQFEALIGAWLNIYKKR
ncbi:MAG: alpha/beta fold hydrolase [Oscillospiraceae bacterium]